MEKSETIFKMIKEHHKKTFEKSKKEGKMDLEFLPLCESIAKKTEYFTSSCCSGRMVLVGLDKKERKKESAFHRKWHRKIKFKELKKGIETFNGEVLWLKQEPIILHIGTNKTENAKKILALCEKIGIKRFGIKVLKEGKIIIEIVGTHNINIPVKEGKICIDNDYLKYITKKCNEKYDKNVKLLKKLTIEIKKLK
jgi:tRNA wybutosine-synthesizing protein 3